MILGIEVRILFRSLSNSSKTPAFVNPSSCNLFTSLGLTLSTKSKIDLKETLGHTKFEVFVGSLIGPLITLPGILS